MSGIIETNDGTLTLYINDFEQNDNWNAICASIDKLQQDKILFIRINSNGGAVDALLQLKSSIDNYKIRGGTVFTHVDSQAFSCGALLLSLGDIRSCSSHARILIHEVSSGMYRSNTNYIVSSANEIDRLNDLVFQFLADSMGQEIDELISVVRNKSELYLSPEDAKATGLIHVIDTPVFSIRNSVLIQGTFDDNSFDESAGSFFQQKQLIKQAEQESGIEDLKKQLRKEILKEIEKENNKSKKKVTKKVNKPSGKPSKKTKKS
jgi:ATP-dependent protease ClpP protease subunit